MNPLRWLILAGRVLLAEAVDAVTGRRRQSDPWTPERKRRAVRNALRSRRGS